MGGNEHALAKMFSAWVLFIDMKRTERDEAAEINARMSASKLTYHEPKKAFKSKWADKHGAKHAGVRLSSPLHMLTRLCKRRRCTLSPDCAHAAIIDLHMPSRRGHRRWSG